MKRQAAGRTGQLEGKRAEQQRWQHCESELQQRIDRQQNELESSAAAVRAQEAGLKTQSLIYR